MKIHRKKGAATTPDDPYPHIIRTTVPHEWILYMKRSARARHIDFDDLLREAVTEYLRKRGRVLPLAKAFPDAQL